MHKKAFTLIELLVVIAIIAILAAILFPVFSQAKDAAKGTASLSNSRQIGIGVSMYASDSDGAYPLNAHSSKETSWLATLQPYAGGDILYRASGDRSTNWENPDPAKRRLSTYATNAYFTPGGGFGAESSISRPASTVYIAELKDNKVGDHFHPQCWGPRGCLSSGHSYFMSPQSELEPERYMGKAHYVFADGHAKRHAMEALFSLPAENQFDPSR